MQDSLGNTLERFDVIHHGGRAGNHGSQRCSVVLEAKGENLAVAFGTWEHRWLVEPQWEVRGKSWVRTAEGVLGEPELVVKRTVLKEQHKEAVKVCPAYYNQELRDLVDKVKETYP